MARPELTVMRTYDAYLKEVLEQVDDSYTLLQSLHDKPGDLGIIKRETAKITGLLQALTSKLLTNKDNLADYIHLAAPARHYLDNHDFFREIEILSLLYSEDSLRLKNLRLTILDALEDGHLMVHIKTVLRQSD